MPRCFRQRARIAAEQIPQRAEFLDEPACDLDGRAAARARAQQHGQQLRRRRARGRRASSSFSRGRSVLGQSRMVMVRSPPWRRRQYASARRRPKAEVAECGCESREMSCCRGFALGTRPDNRPTHRELRCKANASCSASPVASPPTRAPDLVRRLRERGAEVQVVMTRVGRASSSRR